MSGPLPDNSSLLTWLQYEANDPFTSTDDISGMYIHFSNARPDPLDSIKQDDRSHCFLIFVENQSGESHARLLHHLAEFPTRLGAPPTPFDRNWYLTVDQPVSGSMITVDLPDNLFTIRPAAFAFTPERIQRELANNPEATHLEVDENEVGNEDMVQLVT